MLYNVTEDNASDYDFSLSDGTPVSFVKITSKGNIQVRNPADLDDDLRIFRRDGSHFRDELDVTLRATPRTSSGDLIVRDSAVYRLVLVGTLAA